MINNITHFSLLHSTTKPDQLVQAAKEAGMTSLGIAELNNITSCVEFSEACQKQGIKAILGVTLKVKFEENVYTFLLYAKNLDGWKNIIRNMSKSEEIHDFEKLVFDSNNIIIFNDKIQNIISVVESFEEKEADFYVGLDLPMYGDEIEKSRGIAQKFNLKTVATPSCYYISNKNKEDQQLLIGTYLKKTAKDLETLKNSIDFTYRHFFNDQDFSFNHIEGYRASELDRIQEITDKCDNYSILSPPRLPKFEWTEGLTPIEYVRKLCKDGWRKKHNYQWDKQVYGDRVKMELEIIERFDLAGYFLIVQDYVQYAKKTGMFVNYGRGSVAGSIIAYLLDITDVDPIKYDLIFQRFINDARAKGGGLPDIDMDFPVHRREEVIEYIRNRYGHDRVAQMITLGRLQGSSALKEVLRFHSACDNFTANTMTKKLPKEHEIDEYLKDMDHRSIILWVLENQPRILSDYCKIEDGKIVGDYAQYFEQAIRIEGTYKNTGKHAAGLIISESNLGDVCPMKPDKSGETLAALEMNDLEKLGHVKFDILGVQALSRLMSIDDLLQTGEIS